MTTMFTEKINIKDLEETIANSTPLLALVGAGDLAVEKFRAARDELAGRAAAFDPKTVRDQAQAGFASRVEALQSELMAAPERIQALPERAQEWPAKAQSLLADVLSTAFSTYGELAGRGKTRVSQVRRELPDGIELDVEVTPVSRPTTSTARKPTTSTTKRPVATTTTTTTETTSTTTPVTRTSAAKKSATKRTPAKRTTTSTSTAKASTAKRSTAKRSTAKRTTAKRTTAKKTS
jgi:heparin binding hemagglutinin HbhA